MIISLNKSRKLNSANHLWTQAIDHAIYIQNWSPTQALKGITPYEAWTRKKPQVTHFQEFGTNVWILDEDKSKSKFDPCANKHIFVGFNDSARSVKYYKIRTHNILKSRNTKFNTDDEQIGVPIQDLPRSNSNGEENVENTATTKGEEELEDNFCSITPTPNSPNSVMPSLDTTLITPSLEPKSLPTHQMNTHGNRYNYRELNDPYRDIDSMDTTNFIAAMLIDQEIPASTKLAIDMEVQQVMNTMVNGNDSLFDFPQSLKEAKELPEWPKWEKAIQSELNMLHKKGTWKMAELPEGRKAIGNRWVFTKKFDNQGKLSQYKARLVAQGFSQIPGQDFEATFSPVMCMDSLQTLLAIAAVQDLEIGQMDIKGAYLNGDLKEEIYMQQPEGFDDQSGRVCHLIHTLYGLKQSGQEWNSRFNTFLMKNLKYQRLPVDHCIYIWNRNDGYDIIAIWVDDLLMVSTSPETMTKMKVEIEGEFEAMDQGEPKLLLGIEISRDRQTHSITISQGQYIHKCLQCFNMANSGVNSVPIQPGIKFNPTTEDNKFCNPSIYRAAIGSLLYPAIPMSPYLSYTLPQLLQFNLHPSTLHCNAINYLFNYLQDSKNLA